MKQNGWTTGDPILLRLREAVELGLMSQSRAEAIRRAAECAIERLEARQPPFCDGWESWQPDPTWSLPQLPDGWDRR